MLIAITGASGFVGTYTVKALKRAGHQVRALIRQTSRRDHIAECVDEWIVGDFHEPQAQAGLVAGVDCVIHAAVDYDAASNMPVHNVSRNVAGSLNLLEAARIAGAEQFMFISSGAAYAEILPDRKLDENHPTWPDSLYGAYKASVEPFLKAYHKNLARRSAITKGGAQRTTTTPAARRRSSTATAIRGRSAGDWTAFTSMCRNCWPWCEVEGRFGGLPHRATVVIMPAA